MTTRKPGLAFLIALPLLLLGLVTVILLFLLLSPPLVAALCVGAALVFNSIGGLWFATLRIQLGGRSLIFKSLTSTVVAPYREIQSSRGETHNGRPERLSMQRTDGPPVIIHLGHLSTRAQKALLEWPPLRVMPGFESPSRVDPSV